MTLSVLDPSTPGLVDCTVTLQGTTSSLSGNALSCIDNATNVSAPVTLTAQTSNVPPGTLRLAPVALQFTGIAGGGATPAQTLYVINDTSFQLNITGQWSGSSTSSKNGNQLPFSATLIQTGGTFVGAVLETNPAQTSMISGSVVGTSFSAALFDSTGSFSLIGTIGSNTISGSFNGGNDFGTFTLTQQGSAASPLSTLNWTATSNTLTGGSWLNLQTPSGVSTAGSLGTTITASAQTAGLQPGQYSGQILISSPSAANSPVAVTVLLTVLPAASSIAPQTLPTGLVFIARGTTPPAQTLQISTASSSTAQVNVTTSTTNGGAWLASDKTTASLSNASPVNLNISATTTGLASGVYRGQVTLNFGGGSSQVVSVVLVVASGGGVAPARVDSPQAVACTPTLLLAVGRTVGTNFQSSVAWPTTLEVLVTDDCGVLSSSATAVATFSNGDPPVALQALGNGVYSGTWRPVNSTSSVTVTVLVTQPPLTSAQIILGGAVGANPNAPAIFSGGMVNSASYAKAPLPPGAIIATFGNNLAQTGAASSLPLPSQLGGTTLTAAGLNLPLFYTSTGQVNAQLPAELNPGTIVAVVAKTTGTSGQVFSVPEVITIGPAQPGIFSVSQDGQGQGVIVDANNRLLDGKQATATDGQTVVIYCTGLGATTPAVLSGQPAPASPLAVVVSTPLVSIGGTSATVQFAGMTPGLVGLYQINVVVPAGVSGPGVPVVITHQGVVGNTVTMAVH